MAGAAAAHGQCGAGHGGQLLAVLKVVGKQGGVVHKVGQLRSAVGEGCGRGGRMGSS